MLPSPREGSIRMNIIFTHMNHLKQLSQYEWFVNRIETQYRKFRKIWTWFPSSEMRKRMVQVWKLRDLKLVPLQKAAQIDSFTPVVLRPSQHVKVMSSVVNYTIHIVPGQAS